MDTLVEIFGYVWLGGITFGIVLFSCVVAGYITEKIKGASKERLKDTFRLFISIFFSLLMCFCIGKLVSNML